MHKELCLSHSNILSYSLINSGLLGTHYICQCVKKHLKIPKGQSKAVKSKKDRQWNDQMEIDKNRNKDLQNTTQKTNDWATRNVLKAGMNSGAPKRRVPRSNRQIEETDRIATLEKNIHSHSLSWLGTISFISWINSGGVRLVSWAQIPSLRQIEELWLLVLSTCILFSHITVIWWQMFI
jgi:hypothetical protein